MARPSSSLLRRALARFVVLVVALSLLRLSGCPEQLFYLTSRESSTAPHGIEDVFFTTPDGLSLHGWLLRPPSATPGERVPVILHCHGNAGSVIDHLAFSEFLVRDGFAVFLFDYRGYGRSQPGRPTRHRLMLDTHAALDALLARPDIDHSRIGVLGVSLGGVFAARLAMERPEIRACALVAAFSSFPAIAHDHFPILGPCLIGSGLAPAESVAGLGDKPLLVMHGESDTIVSPRHADRIADAARRAGVHVEVARSPAGHNDILDHPPEQMRLSAFFRSALAPR